MKRNSRFALLLSMLLLCAACSRQEAAKPEAAAPPAPAAADLSACALVTKADVAAIAGIAAKNVTPGLSGPMTSRCTFVAEDASGVDVVIKKSPGKYNVESQIAGMKKAMPGVPFREAAGLGDRAFFIGGQLNVFRGDAYVLISMLGFPAHPKTDEAARKLAEKVLGQI